MSPYDDTRGKLDVYGGGGAVLVVSPPIALTSPETEMRKNAEKANRTIFDSVVLGSQIGVGFEILIGAAFFEKGKGRVRKSARNSSDSGFLIGVESYTTVKKKQAGNDEVRAMQSAVKDLQQDNKRLEQMIASSNTVLKDGQDRLDALKIDIAAGKISAKEAEDARKREESNIAVMQNSLKKAKETRDQYASAGQKISTSANTRKDLDSEIKRTDSQIAQLERNIADYSRAIAVSRA